MPEIAEACASAESLHEIKPIAQISYCSKQNRLRGSLEGQLTLEEIWSDAKKFSKPLSCVVMMLMTLTVSMDDRSV